MSNFTNDLARKTAQLGSVAALIEKQTEFEKVAQPNININSPNATINVPGVTATPPAQSPPATNVDAQIEPLDFPHVKPGDLITADFVNDLIDVVVAIDTRLQRIEIILAPFIDRETKKLQAAAAESTLSVSNA